MEELSTITANGKQIRVIYSKQEQGLYLSFSSDEKIREYILRNTEEAFCESVTVDDEGTYWLKGAKVTYPYAPVDIKPENMGLTPTGELRFLDVDWANR